jgi:putative flippase GtrA
VFRQKGRLRLTDMLIFFSVTAFSSLIIQNTIIILFESSWLYGHNALEINMVKALAVGVGMIWNYMFYKYAVFSSRKNQNSLEMET